MSWIAFVNWLNEKNFKLDELWEFGEKKKLDEIEKWYELGDLAELD